MEWGHLVVFMFASLVFGGVIVAVAGGVARDTAQRVLAEWKPSRGPIKLKAGGPPTHDERMAAFDALMQKDAEQRAADKAAAELAVSMWKPFEDDSRITLTGFTVGRVIPKDDRKTDPEPEPVLLAALRAKQLKPDAQYTMRDIAPEHVGDFLDWIDGLKRALADAETEAAMQRQEVEQLKAKSEPEEHPRQ